MALLMGVYQIPLEQKTRLRLPCNFVRNLGIPKRDRLLGYPMIVAPTTDTLPIFPFTLEKLTIFPFSYFQGSHISSWLGEISWTKQIHEIVSRNKIHPSIPFYKTDKVSGKVRAAIETLKGEIKRSPETLRNLSGKDFERLLYEILASVGINVQLNVHILGTEIDLLLLQLSEHGRVEFTIIECKHRQRSQKVVGIGQVMRLYGLKEVLKKSLCVKNALIVSTTDFSPNAKRFAKLYQLDLVNYESFLDWIIQHGLFSNSQHYPLFRMINLDRRGRFRLPKSLTSYLKNPDRPMTVLGLFELIELWNSSTWEVYYKHIKPVFEELAKKIEEVEV